MGIHIHQNVFEPALKLIAATPIPYIRSATVSAISIQGAVITRI
ncbi:MAG: hypothetical protein WC685_15800 [Methylobacter sp.]|jgi:hypothetical protein